MSNAHKYQMFTHISRIRIPRYQNKSIKDVDEDSSNKEVTLLIPSESYKKFLSPRPILISANDRKN